MIKVTTKNGNVECTMDGSAAEIAADVAVIVKSIVDRLEESGKSEVADMIKKVLAPDAPVFNEKAAEEMEKSNEEKLDKVKDAIDALEKLAKTIRELKDDDCE